ncbi:MAG: hypothetical protein AMXMBFR80_09290 [Dehalococcoidia bacterium]
MGRFFVSVTVATSTETLARECTSPLVIGRSEECDLHLAHPLVSRRHASVELAPQGGYVVTDLESRNGTLVDGVEVRGSSTAAADGSLIQIGPFTLKLAGNADAAEETALAPIPSRGQKVTLEPDLRRMLVDGQTAVDRLSPQEFRFIRALVERSPGVVPTKQAGDHIWGEDKWDLYMLHNLVRRVRRKIEESGFAPEIIENIPGSGYRIA